MATIIFWWGVINYPGMVFLPLLDKTRGRALLTYLGAMFGGVGASAYARHAWYPQFIPPSWAETQAWFLFGWLCIIIGLIVVIVKPTKKRLNSA